MIELNLSNSFSAWKDGILTHHIYNSGSHYPCSETSKSCPTKKKRILHSTKSNIDTPKKLPMFLRSRYRLSKAHHFEALHLLVFGNFLHAARWVCRGLAADVSMGSKCLQRILLSMDFSGSNVQGGIGSI